MVEVGYGRVVQSSHLTGKVDFYGGDQVLNDKGKDKVIDAMLDDVSESGLNHTLHSGDQEDPKPKKYKGSLKSSHGEKVYTLEEWYSAYEDNTYGEITTEAGYKQGLPAGPKMRYVRNPIDGNVMDMRHVSVVGYGMGNTAGDMVEHIQYATGDRSNSAYDIQDYYSNKTGAYFYQMRHSGSWASSSWAYDFKRFILTQFRTLQPAIMANIPKK
jgi:hypothetical protein